MAAPFALPADVEYRYPREIGVLAADERTRQIDWDRVQAALADVSMEMRAILLGRYTSAQIDDVDEDSLGLLRGFAIDMALYRVSLNFNRQTEASKARYDTAVARLEAIVKGRGALSFRTAGGDQRPTSPGEVLIDAPERMFSRDTMRGL